MRTDEVAALLGHGNDRLKCFNAFLRNLTGYGAQTSLPPILNFVHSIYSPDISSSKVTVNKQSYTLTNISKANTTVNT